MRSFELYFPTKLNEELQPFMGKDFDMDIVKEGKDLKIFLTPKTSPKHRLQTLKKRALKALNL